MENLVKGYVTSLIALIGLILIALHVMGFYEFPNPQFLDKGYEAGIGALLCFGLFFIKRSLLESWIEEIYGALKNIVIKIFNRKSDA